LEKLEDKVKKQRTLKQILMAGLGKSWMMWPPRAEVKRRCKIEGKSGWYRCEDQKCKRETEKLEIDHILPVVKPEDGFVGYDVYIASKFVQADKLQGLCHESHQQKTQEENKARREAKKKNKIHK
jgi:hypothetical protein